jgi:predicted HAD superfamily Cof-like phosphohydrolase
MSDPRTSFSSADFQNMVRDFHQHMGHPVAQKPDAAQLLFRSRLIIEEAAEFVEAASRGDEPDMIDALCDLLYVTFGTGVVMGVDLAPIFAQVHAKNMQKIPASSPTEKPAKPAGWIAPQDEARRK